MSLGPVVATGPEPRDPDIPLINIPNNAPSNATSISETSQLPPVEENAATSTNARVEYGPIEHHNGLTDVAHNGGFAKKDPPVSKGRHFKTEVDIIGVPAIGGHPEKTWTPRPVYSQDALSAPERPSAIGLELLRMAPVSPAFSASPAMRTHTTRSGLDKQEPAWITRGIRNRKDLQHARVLLYDHGYPEENDTLKILANRLLEKIEELRRAEDEARPIFFVCHSTGGLVVKMALTEAQRSKSPILGDCFGVSFFATPHRGSSYLSMPEFSNSIEHIMHLSRPLPEKIARQLKLDYHLLRKLGSDFKALSTELKIWTFFETNDSDLTNPDLVESERFPFHAPITSIKSAILNLRHEVVYPLNSDHTESASFGNKNAQTKESYLEELAYAVKEARELSKIKHTEMNLEEHVKVEIIGFYEGAVLTSNVEKPIRVWSTKRSLGDFIRYGPSQLLKQRLAEGTVQPRDTQYIRHNTRAPSLLPGGPLGARNDYGFPPAPAFKSNPFDQQLDSSQKRPKILRRGKSKDRASSSQSQDIKVATATPALVLGTGDDVEVDPMDSAPKMKAPSKSSPSHLDIASTSENALGIISTLGPDTPPDLVTSAGLLMNGTHLAPTSPSRRHSDAHQSLLKPLAHHKQSISSRGRRGSEGAMAPVSFLKPDISNQKLTWVHVPFNNPSWVKNVLERITLDQGRDCHSRLLNPDNWKSKHVRGRHSEHHACYVKPGCSFIGPEMASPAASPRKSGGTLPSPTQMCLYLPFLHFDTYKVLVRRRQLVKRRIQQGRSRPVPLSVAKLESLEFRVLWQFLGHDPPINCRRTLDQFGYPSLLDTSARDDDQMLYKMTKQRCRHPDDVLLRGGKEKDRKDAGKPTARDDETGDEDQDDNADTEVSVDEDEEESDDEDILDGNVLMVDQLWLWIIDEATTVTFFPRKEPLTTDGRLYQQADLRNSIFNEVNADLTSRCENSFDLAALVALHAVTVLFERSSHPDLEIFRTFEEAISILTEKMTNSFKKFRARGFRDKATEYDDPVRTTSIRAKHKREGAAAEKQNRENTSALLELRDIEDELNTLKNLFDDQTVAIHLMMEGYRRDDIKGMTANGLSFLKQAAQKLDEYIHHVEKMIESVKATRDDFDKLLQMVQRQAQVMEVRLARLQADLASAQSRSVMIFTVFTVIFLPLTFFTGLFGMNVQEWGGSNFISIRTIGIVSLPASFTIITVALIIAWSTRMRRIFNLLLRKTRRLATKSRKSFLALLTYIPAAAAMTSKEKRKKSMQEKKERKRALKEARREALNAGEDFWGSHVVLREAEYKVPPQNRRSVSLARAREQRKMMIKEMGKGRIGAGAGMGVGLGEEWGGRRGSRGRG